MNTGKNELSPEIIETIRSVVKEEIGNAIMNQHPFFGMLESENVFMEEQERLHEHPLKGILGHVTKVTRTEDGQTFGIKLNERGREILRMNEEFKGFQLEALLRINEILNEMVEKAKEVYGLH